MGIQQSNDRIQTTHIGSLPRPHDLLDIMKAKFAEQPYDDKAYQRSCRRRSRTASESRSIAALIS
jgi:methionine synthase II (cobalamin-independent)